MGRKVLDPDPDLQKNQAHGTQGQDCRCPPSGALHEDPLVMIDSGGSRKLVETLMAT